MLRCSRIEIEFLCGAACAFWWQLSFYAYRFRRTGQNRYSTSGGYLIYSLRQLMEHRMLHGCFVDGCPILTYSSKQLSDGVVYSQPTASYACARLSVVSRPAHLVSSFAMFM
jgi:hypothetical protein